MKMNTSLRSRKKTPLSCLANKINKNKKPPNLDFKRTWKKYDQRNASFSQSAFSVTLQEDSFDSDLVRSYIHTIGQLNHLNSRGLVVFFLFLIFSGFFLIMTFISFFCLCSHVILRFHRAFGLIFGINFSISL